MTALVLSGSYTETSRFASQHKLGYGVRHIVSAEGLAGRRPTSIHILPSYYDRRDIHATNAALKKLRRRVAHITPIEYDQIDGVWVVKGTAPLDSSGTSSSLEVVPAPAPDESKDAVPGQIPIEEVIRAMAEPGSLEEVVLESLDAGEITVEDIQEAVGQSPENLTGPEQQAAAALQETATDTHLVVTAYDAEPASPVVAPPLPPADADADDLPDWLK